MGGGKGPLRQKTWDQLCVGGLVDIKSENLCLWWEKSVRRSQWTVVLPPKFIHPAIISSLCPYFISLSLFHLSVLILSYFPYFLCLSLFPLSVTSTHKQLQ